MARTADKRGWILSEIRRRIVEGDLDPGSRLPSRSEFEQTFEVSPTTIQQVFDRLRSDGFVDVKGRYATYVAMKPPHLTRYAIAFPAQPSSHPDEWPRSWNALTTAAADLGEELDRTLEFFYEIRENSRHQHYENLVTAVQNHCLAGLIFVNRPLEQFGLESPIFREPNIPRVAISADTHTPVKLPLIVRNYESFFDRALEHLAERGCKKVAVVTTPNRYRAQGAYFEEAVAVRGLTTRPYWQQLVHPSGVEAAKLNVQLLFGPEQKVQPDGLIIADDNLVDPVKAGLLATGMPTDGPLPVVAHCAFPSPPDTVLPMTRLGFDTRHVLRLCIERIDQQRRGETAPELSHVGAIFEHEQDQSVANS